MPDKLFFKPLIINDFNFNGFTNDEIQRIKDGLKTHHLVLLKKQDISMSQQVDFTNLFGEIELVWEDKHPKSNNIQLLQNKPKNYKPFKSTSKHWHTDRSFVKIPSKLTFLYAIEIGNRCGGTEFCNLHQAYLDLDDDFKKKLSKLHGIHAFDYKFPDLMRKKLYTEEKIKGLVAKYPNVIKPLVLINSLSNKKSLFLSELCLKKIVELNEKESKKILEFLYKHVLDNKYRFTQHWEEGDLLIWDNESLMHRALDTPIGIKRKFYRTTTMA